MKTLDPDPDSLEMLDPDPDTTLLQRKPKRQRCSAEFYFTALLKFMNKPLPCHPIIVIFTLFGRQFNTLGTEFGSRSAVLRIRKHMFLGLLDPDPDPLVRSMDPDPSIIKKNSKKNLDFYCFVAFLTFISETGCKCTFKK
jgi:hypothetical protein